MNKGRAVIVLTLLWITCYLLSGCRNINDSPQNVSMPKAGYGKVAVTINGTTMRTVFPAKAFARYEYLFAKVTNGQIGAPEAQAPVDGYFLLELGDWQVTVKAYTNADDTQPAATGTSSTFTVTGEAIAQVPVKLAGNAESGAGNFTYYITYPKDAEISIFKLENLADKNAVISITGGGTAGENSVLVLSGTRASVPAGCYFLTIQIGESGGEGRTTGANEVVYIYDKLDSAYHKDFTAEDLSHIHQWYGWTQTSAPTCTMPGIRTRVCSHNTAHIDQQPDPIDPNAHEYANWTQTSAPTETVDGLETRACIHNGAHIESRTLYATGTEGFAFELINNNTAYRLGTSTVTKGAVYIPAYYRPNANSAYLPVMEISDYATSVFGGTSENPNTAITSVTFAEDSQLTAIDIYAFSYCSALTDITLPASVTSIGSYAFQNCTSLTSIEIPAGVTSIGDCAFFDCTSLASVTIPEGITTISGGAFYGCTSLTDIPILPASVTAIGSIAFALCTSLASITIPNSVTSIGNGAFRDCTGLTNVTLPASVMSIDIGAFKGCSNLASITVDAGNPNYTSESGILYNKEKTILFAYPSAKGNVTIPAGVRSIGGMAFQECTSLTGIEIPAGVTFIGNQAFLSCRNLNSITIPAGVTSIDRNAFYYWTNQQTISIEGHASQAAADAAWGSDWRNGCSARIVYQGG